MRLITRLTDRLTERLAPKAAARARCTAYEHCASTCSAAGRQCCYRTADCVTGCYFKGC